MRTRRKKIAKFPERAEDIPIMELYEWLEKVIGGDSDAQLKEKNTRVRLQHTETCLPWDEHESTVYGMSVWSNEPMTDEEVEEECVSLAKRKAEREVEDRALFENLKTRYGWE